MGRLNMPMGAEVLLGKSFSWAEDFDERPVHTVKISEPCCMASFEVTDF